MIRGREDDREHSSLEEDGWDFWEFAGLSSVGYSPEIDIDLRNVLRAVAEKKFNEGIAHELDLPRQYVELLQSILCSVGWAEYGTSPRGCWIDPRHTADELIAKVEEWMRRKWGADVFEG